METLISIIILVIGLAVGYYFGVKKDIKAKKREISTRYLIDAYRMLVNDLAGSKTTPEIKKKFEAIFTDIQLFGSANQIQLAINLAEKIVSNASETEEFGKLLILLRDDLRKELNLSKVEGEIKVLSFSNRK